MTTQENSNVIDLGSDPMMDDFDSFASDDDLEQDIPAETPKQQRAKKSPSPASANPMASAIQTAETKEAEKTRQGLFEKPPVFEYAGATEEIEDTAKTFDELRIEKATDFPELEDGKRVSWTMEYGKIVKAVSDPKATSIGKMKAEIETSKAFLDSLKKAKDKNPACKVKPRVTAQSKGAGSAYKGVFTSLDEAETSGKLISIVPAKDGKVYEIRNTEMGKFITPVVGCDMLSDVRAGFIPALPLIPKELMIRIISFFRHYMREENEQEVLVNIYWDKRDQSFFIDVPEQVVTKSSIKSRVAPDYASDRYIHYMDIHSHNSMKAFFSGIDDNDEKATRLYTVIGRLDKYFPDMLTRLFNGSSFLFVNPAEVFERISCPFPDEWKDNVRFRNPHDEEEDVDHEVCA